MSLTRFKVVFIGDISVGKTSILQRFIYNKFKNYVPATIGSAYYSHKLDNNNNIDFWDTCGDERFNSYLKLYYRNSHILLLVYDIYNYVSSCKKLINVLNDIDNIENTKIFIIGNKLDLINDSFKLRQIDQYISDIFRHYNITNMCKVSAKNGDNIDNLFNNIIEELKNRTVTIPKNIILFEEEIQHKPNSKCC